MSSWIPARAAHNLRVMSIAFLLGSREDAVVWRGPKKTCMERVCIPLISVIPASRSLSRTYTHTHTHSLTHSHSHTHIYIYTLALTHARIGTQVYIYIFIYALMHTFTHKYMHSYSCTQSDRGFSSPEHALIFLKQL